MIGTKIIAKYIGLRIVNAWFSINLMCVLKDGGTVESASKFSPNSANCKRNGCAARESAVAIQKNAETAINAITIVA